MNKWKHKILPALLAGTLTFSFGAAVDAKGNGHINGHGKGKGPVHVKVENNYFIFVDMKQHWAAPVVKLMMEKNVIKGYSDYTFRPNKPVTQLEAIVMVMNLLKQHKELSSNGNSYIGGEIPAWAKDPVVMALANDIISWKDLKQLNKPATRMYVVKLLVNALGANLDEHDHNNLFFGDVAALSPEDKAYLSFALLQMLVQGYEDKTFKPNKPVTRAEMAVFVKRLLDKVLDVDFGTRVKGTIAGIDKDDHELVIGSKTYKVSDDVVVKLDGKNSNFDSLSVGMKVDVILKDNKIQTIYAYTSGTQSDVTFKIDKVTDGKPAVDLVEAVKQGSRVSDSTPDLSNETLYIVLNENNPTAVDVSSIDGSEDNGDDVANELEEAIAEALGNNDRVDVSFDNYNSRFVFETQNSAENVVPSIRFYGTALAKLGLDTSIAKGSLGKEPVAESWQITVKSDASTDKTYVVKLEDENIKASVEINVDDDDRAEEIAKKIADALKGNEDIRSAYSISLNNEVVTITSTTSGKDLDVEIEIAKK